MQQLVLADLSLVDEDNIVFGLPSQPTLQILCEWEGYEDGKCDGLEWLKMSPLNISYYQTPELRVECKCILFSTLGGKTAKALK